MKRMRFEKLLYISYIQVSYHKKLMPSENQVFNFSYRFLNRFDFHRKVPTQMWDFGLNRYKKKQKLPS